MEEKKSRQLGIARPLPTSSVSIGAAAFFKRGLLFLFGVGLPLGGRRRFFDEFLHEV